MKMKLRDINTPGIITVLTGMLGVLIFATFIIYNVAYAFEQGSEQITIEDKWVKHKGSSAKYLVSSTDGQVFQITDSFIHTRFDSSNLYAKIKPGQTCTLTTQGFRFELLSDYKNIIEATCTHIQ